MRRTLLISAGLAVALWALSGAGCKKTEKTTQGDPHSADGALERLREQGRLDVCVELIFDEISLESVLEFAEAEQPAGVVVSMGGQVPNNTATRLAAAGVHILGTDAAQIDRAEDMNHTRPRKRKSVEVSAPTGQMSTTLPE